MTDTVILICAAGNSTRMGETDKLMIDVGGEPLLRRQVRRATDVMADVCVAHSPQKLERVSATRGLVVENATFGPSNEGLSGTLRAAATKLSDYTYMMVVLADLPLLTPIHFARMLNAPRDFPKAKIWRAVDADNKPGHPTLFHKSVFKDFADLYGDDGAKAVLEHRKGVVQDVAFKDKAPTFDIDTLDDLATFQKMI